MASCTPLLMIASMYFQFKWLTVRRHHSARSTTVRRLKKCFSKSKILPHIYNGALNGRRSSKLQNICTKSQLAILRKTCIDCIINNLVCLAWWATCAQICVALGALSCRWKMPPHKSASHCLVAWRHVRVGLEGVETHQPSSTEGK